VLRGGATNNNYIVFYLSRLGIRESTPTILEASTLTITPPMLLIEIICLLYLFLILFFGDTHIFIAKEKNKTDKTNT
jgi:hypothetical protein